MPTYMHVQYTQYIYILYTLSMILLDICEY